MPFSSQAGRPTPAAPHRRILINSSFERTVPIIRANIEKLGHKITDVKIFLSSHVHGDHVAGRGITEPPKSSVNPFESSKNLDDPILVK